MPIILRIQNNNLNLLATLTSQIYGLNLCNESEFNELRLLLLLYVTPFPRIRSNKFTEKKTQFMYLSRTC